MYIEDRVKALEDKISFLEKQMTDFKTKSTSSKPVLRFIAIDVPMPYEDYTYEEVRVSVDGEILTFNDEGIEREVLTGYSLNDWVNALSLSLDDLKLSRGKRLEIESLIKALADAPSPSSYVDLQESVKKEFVLQYDSCLEVSLEEFYIAY